MTRLIARSWTRRQSTGIDRVTYAYLKHFRNQALAVFQYRGVIRALGPRRSDKLFDMLLAPAVSFRKQFVPFVSVALGSAFPSLSAKQVTYLNVSHTDFDLSAHHQWVKRSRLRSAYFIHDLIPIQRPELTRPHAVKRHLGRVNSALRYADRIVVSSTSVASDLRAFADKRGLNPPPILVAPLAGAPLFQSGKDVEPKAGANQYFLCIGTVEPRKNHMLLLKLWRNLVEKMGASAPQLIIVGQTGALSEEVLLWLKQRPELTGAVRLITKCSDAELADLLAGARALLMPTFAEGYGLPVVEALQTGTPVIASDIPIFREIGQGIPLLLDANDLAGWEKTIETYTGPAIDRKRQLAAARLFKPPLWEEHFDQLERWFDLPDAQAANHLQGSEDSCVNA